MAARTACSATRRSSPQADTRRPPTRAITQTWDEIYKQAVDLKKRGIVENPILPTWFKAWTGTPWALYAHGASEGDRFVNDDMKSTFGLDTPILKELSDWKRWSAEEPVPRAILTWQKPEMASSWMKGLHAFHYQSD